MSPMLFDEVSDHATHLENLQLVARLDLSAVFSRESRLVRFIATQLYNPLQLFTTSFGGYGFDPRIMSL